MNRTIWIVWPTYAARGVVCVFTKPSSTAAAKHVAYIDCRVMIPKEVQVRRPDAMHIPPTEEAGCTDGGRRHLSDSGDPPSRCKSWISCLL